MARRQRLSETQIAELFDPPAEQRELVRHFTLLARGPRGDPALSRRRQSARLRADALLPSLPGRALRVGERPPGLARFRGRADRGSSGLA